MAREVGEGPAALASVYAAQKQRAALVKRAAVRRGTA